MPKVRAEHSPGRAGPDPDPAVPEATAPGCRCLPSRRFRYLGPGERIVPGPPPRVLSPGDVVESPTNPDPACYCAMDLADPGPASGEAVT